MKNAMLRATPLLKMIFPAVLLLVLFFGCQQVKQAKIESPSGNIAVTVNTSDNGSITYSLSFKGNVVIQPSGLGFELLDQAPIEQGLSIKGISTRSFNETWEMPLGEQRFVENKFNELTVGFQEDNNLRRRFDLIFRVYDDGLGFRYEFPEQPNLKKVFITEENTWYHLSGDRTCWWLPGDWDISEHLYTSSSFSAIDALSKRNHNNLAQTYIPVNAVLTPFTMKSGDGIYLSFHEAVLVDYAGVTMQIYPEKLAMRTNLVGSSRNYKVEQQTPFRTPWRTIQMSGEAGKLIKSRLLLNLNEPNKLGDVSVDQTHKICRHLVGNALDKSTWSYGKKVEENGKTILKPHGRHGATTENTKRYIDFAAASNIGAVLVEGWNTGWEDWIGTSDREGIFDFVTPYPDYDLHEVLRYAREKGVRMIMHNETSAAVSTYEQQLDTAFRMMEHLGFDMVKTGYVGTIIPEGEYHHNQRMVNHYMKVVQTAAKHKVAVDSHESIIPTGLRRTYPNIISCENIRGQEFNAWSSDGGNPPSHLPTVAFTRMLAGPIDYTPGIFNIKIKPYKPNNQVNTTLAHQLALYVVIYSPIQMAADLPEHYEGHPAFRFIYDVGVDWEQSKVLNGEIGQYVTMAREEKGSGNWFLGSITGETPRKLIIKTDFLAEGKKYHATLYADGDKAHWDENPTSYQITRFEADCTTEIELNLAAGGGAAISFKVTEDEP